MRKTWRKAGKLWWAGLALAALLIVGCETNAPGRVADLPDAPQIWLDQPRDGSHHVPGKAITVQAHGRDAHGPGIVEVRLYVNSTLVSSVGTDATAPLAEATLTWTPPAPGDYVIELRAVNSSGAASEPATARVTIGPEAEEPEPDIPTPVQITFSADQTSLQYGECTTLRWGVSNAQSVQLDSESVPEQGSRQVCPMETSTTYRLAVTSGAGERVEQTVSISLLPTPTPPPGVEVSFAADQAEVSLGTCTMLRWSVAHAQAVHLDGSSVPNQGSQQVCPQQPSNTYRLTAVSLEGETVERAVTIRVPATPTPSPTPSATVTHTPSPTATPSPSPTATTTPSPTPSPTPPPPQIEFWSDSYSLESGECTVLRWHIEHVQAAFLNGTGVTGPDGYQQVCPDSTTTYVLTVNLTGGGSDARSLTISVSALPTPAPPANVQWDHVGGGESLREVEISWDPSPGAADYVVRIYTCEAGVWTRQTERTGATLIYLRDDGDCSGGRPVEAGDGVQACSGAGCSASTPIPW